MVRMTNRTERTWDSFAGLRNDGSVLQKKAQALAPVILYSAHLFCESLSKALTSEAIPPDKGELFFEALAIDLQFVQRVAFKLLGIDRRGLFLDPLVVPVDLD